MHLVTYLHESKLSAAKFGREIGVARSTVIRYLLGERVPNKEAMARIYQVTRGQVRPDDFYELPHLEEAAQ